MKKQKGITLVALVVTIVILLILAGVSINMVLGDNGLIEKANDAKIQTELSNEKTQIQLAYLGAKISEKAIIKESELQLQLNKNFGEDKTFASPCGDGFDVYIKDKNYYYNLDKNGEISGPYDVIKVEYPGDITKNGKYDGDTEETAYQIECVEDLVSLSQTSSKSREPFKGKYIKLIRDLDFKCIYSYNDYQTKEYSSFLSKNTSTMIMDSLMIDVFIAVQGEYSEPFYGIFLGNNKSIKNFYSNSGLFNNISNGKICDLTIKGSGNIDAGITRSASNSIISNCVNYINCKRAGIVKIASNVEILNCINYGNITDEGVGHGGIVDECTGNSKIISCTNKGNINGNIRCEGGILAQQLSSDDGGEIYIYNCKNEGEISGNGKVGGIVGASYINEGAALKIERCMNKGNIIATDRGPGGIFGDCSPDHPRENYSQITIKECYNNSQIKGTIGWAGQISGSWIGTTNVNFINNFYTLLGGEIKGISTKDDIDGKINAINKEYENIDELLSDKGL